MPPGATSEPDVTQRLANLIVQDRSVGGNPAPPGAHAAAAHDAEPADDWDDDADNADWGAAAVPQFARAGTQQQAAQPAAASPSSRAGPTPAERNTEGSAEAAAAVQTATPLREVAFEGGHIIEFYGLNETTTSTDLEAYLQKVDRGSLPALVRWVDEEHALVLFSNPDSAQHALRTPGKYRARPFSKASAAARAMPAKQLAPPAPRPRTSAAVASRLIGSALGVRGLRDAAGEADLAAQRKAQADSRRLKQASLAAAWDDS